MCRYGVNAKEYFDEYLPGSKRTVFHTKKGLSWRNAWGVLRYSANNAFIAYVHADQMKEQVSPLSDLLCFLPWSLRWCCTLRGGSLFATNRQEAILPFRKLIMRHLCSSTLFVVPLSTRSAI